MINYNLRSLILIDGGCGMSRIIKTACMLLGVCIMLVLGITVNKPVLAEELESVNISKTDFWSTKGFMDIVGDNLSSSHEATINTTQFQIQRRPTTDYSFEIVLLDKNEKTLARTTINKGESTGLLTVHKGDLEENAKYYFGVNERDSSGGISEVYKIASMNILSAVELEPPSLDVVLDTDKVVTGKGMANKKIIITLGTEKYTSYIDANGKFAINLDTTFQVGTGITAYIEDENGKQSGKVVYVVQKGAILVGVNKVVSSDTEVSGHTDPNTLVEVAVNNTKMHIYEGVSDSSGYFKVSMNGNHYPARTAIKVIAKSSSQTSEPLNIIVYPKKVTINTVVEGDTYLKGKADENAMVYLLIGENKYEVSADGVGNFSTDVSKLVQGDRIIAYQISNEIKSDEIEVDINSRK